MQGTHPEIYLLYSPYILPNAAPLSLGSQTLCKTTPFLIRFLFHLYNSTLPPYTLPCMVKSRQESQTFFNKVQLNNLGNFIFKSWGSVIFKCHINLRLTFCEEKGIKSFRIGYNNQFSLKSFGLILNELLHSYTHTVYGVEIYYKMEYIL